MALKSTMGCISMMSIRSSIISLVHATVFFLHFGVSSFSRRLCTTRVVVIIYIHKLMLIRILSSDWSISIQVPSKLKKKRMHFYSIQVRSSFLIQVSCMVYTIKKLEFKKLGCKTCIVYTGLYPLYPLFALTLNKQRIYIWGGVVEILYIVCLS